MTGQILPPFSVYDPNLSGSGGGGGSKLLYAQTANLVGPSIVGRYVAGSTSFTLLATADEMNQLFVGGHILIGLENHVIASIDVPGLGITIVNGITTTKVNAPVLTGCLLGTDDTLQLPSMDPHSEIDVRFTYDLPRKSGTALDYYGRSVGVFYAGEDDNHGSWFEILTNYGAWHAAAQTEQRSIYPVGLITSGSGSINAWFLEFDPANGLLSFSKINTTASSYLPRITSMIVAGR